MKIKNKIILIIAIIITIINTFTCTISRANSTTDTLQNQSTKTITYISENSPSNTQYQSTPEPSLSLYSKTAVLIDSSTGKILYGKSENEKQYPASTTKILTAILAIENCNLTDKATASYNAVMSIPIGYSNAAIQVGESLSIQELLDLFLIHSANEAGFILAEHISGSIENFANLMNQKAIEIGCTNTHFTNPSGIHDTDHYSTAYDMALIAKYCMKNDTFRNIVSKTSCTVEETENSEKRYFKNTNDLLDPSSKYYYQYAIGIKTGFTSQAKNCLIAASLKDGLELITVVLGANSQNDRYSDTTNLFEYGYSNYKMQEIITKNRVVEEITITGATKDTEVLPLLSKDSITSIVPINFNPNNLDYSIELHENITAPISEGAVLGKISYTIDGINYSSDIIASHSVEKSNLLMLICQIALAVFVLIILSKLVSTKKKVKKKKKKGKSKKSKRKCDSIYKFN